LYSNSSIALLLPCFHNLFSSCRDDEESPTYATTAPPISPAAADEPAEPDVAPRGTRAAVRKVLQARKPKCSKKAKETDVSLEAHASTVSPDDVSNFSFTRFPCIHSCSYTIFLLGIIEKIRRLGH
jgi:hypothetical protein